MAMYEGGLVFRVSAVAISAREALVVAAVTLLSLLLLLLLLLSKSAHRSRSSFRLAREESEWR